MSQSLSNVSNQSTDLVNLISNDKALQAEIEDAQLCNGLAINLYHLRNAVGLTQKQLAERLGVKQSNISRWEQVGYQGYKVKMLSKIARALNGKLEISLLDHTPNYITEISMLEADHLDITVNPLNYNDLNYSFTNPRLTSIVLSSPIQQNQGVS